MLRTAGRLLLGVFLRFFYLIGWSAGAVIVAGATVLGAVRLGWSDVRKRGEHDAG